MRVIITAGLLTLPVTALAVNTEPAGFYAGIGVSQIDYSGKAHASISEKPDWTALELSGGYKHNPFVGVESRIGVGGSPELLYGGLYYRTESANDTAKTYLLLGFAGANIKAKTGSDLSLAGPSYGAGVGFPVSRNFNFNLEYRVVVDDSDEHVNLNAFTASLDYRFSGFSGGRSSSSDSGSSSQYINPQDRGFYAGLGIAKIDLKVDEPGYEGDDEEMEEDEGGGEPSWNAVELIGGYSHSPWATVEMRLGTTDNAGEEGVDLTLNYASLYYRPSISFSQIELYGLVGFSSVRLKFEEDAYYDDEELIEGETESFSFSGASVGAGVSASITEQLSAGLEYRLLVRDDLKGEVDEEDETWDFTAVSANVNYRF
ncbi:outer membrane beta-barrel protein [Cellvibrio fibrivorans]|uniref:Opacity protein-like surface antigen n=1 Tax=Cellvibrio fibrivorans TaxID=126350 RepID=A0ABU1UZD6_9GAMM|nr:outer membrane beta-barrel protein [Cellvibrio fibrivorans]MDR7090541.1 opacity protein-like surface antigen [Cellvibrio fibrivorans]